MNSDLYVLLQTIVYCAHPHDHRLIHNQVAGAPRKAQVEYCRACGSTKYANHWTRPLLLERIRKDLLK